MPANKLALLRYRIIDKCLQNGFKKWTLNDLIEAVSDALYEYEGITSGVSKRTIQLDIQTMRSDKLGYDAPIEVVGRKYYHYAEEGYSITNSPLSDQDVDKLTEVVSLLKQFKGFSYFNDLIGVSKSPNHKPIEVILRVEAETIPYLKTKPLHDSQEISEEKDGYGLVEITVIWNFELEREILGRGESIEVISPPRLRRKIRKRLRDAYLSYD